MDNIGIVVESLDAPIPFFTELDRDRVECSACIWELLLARHRS